MIAQPQGECDDRECRIVSTICREHGTSSNKEVADAVQSTVCVDHPLFGIIVHPRRPHVVETSVRQVTELTIEKENAAQPRSAYLPGKDFHAFPDARDVDLTQPPIENDPPLAEAIEVVSKHNPTVRVG